MKKLALYLLIIIALVSLSACFSNVDTNIIKGFSSKKEHFDKESFRDYTDYAEYIYINDNDFANSKAYKMVTPKDVTELNEFFKDYLKWIKKRDGYKEWFSFDYKSQVKENDYFILNIKDSAEPYGKFHNYDIYYFDTKTLTLYYFHSNS